MTAPRIDIDRATQDDFDAIEGLKGHGFEIVRFRQERGRFTALRQLNEVPGLSAELDPATLQQLTV